MPPEIPVPPPAEMGWPAAIVAIVLTLGPALIALLRELLRLRRQRDALVEGIERSGDKQTKRQVQLAAEGAGVEGHLRKLVTRRYPKAGEGDAQPRNGKAPPLALLLALALLTLPGCASGLQAQYVTAMERTYDAIALDVEAGLYRPDARGRATLERWERANADARAALEEDAR